MATSEPFLEDYIKLDELGQGGYATVYKVRHKDLGYIRAIKVLNNTIADGKSDRIYQKFLKECRLLLRLGNGNHPNIVHIYRPLLRAQKAMVEMDFVDGKDLFHYLQDNSFFVEIKEIKKLLTDIGSALAYCHEDIYKFCMDRNEDELKDDPNDGSKVLLDDQTRCKLINKYRVIHNNIHSGNIMRRNDGNFVLLDFDLAVDSDAIVRSSRKKEVDLEFKAPEKWDKNNIPTTQSDIYSFGVVLYEFLTGRVPFIFDKNNPNPTEAEYLLCKAHKETMPEPIYELRKAAFEHSHPGKKYEKDYPDWLEELIMKCLAKNPEDRFQNGKDLTNHINFCIYKDLLSITELRKESTELINVVLENNELIKNLGAQKKQLLSKNHSYTETFLTMFVLIGVCPLLYLLDSEFKLSVFTTWVNITSSLLESIQYIINYICS